MPKYDANGNPIKYDADGNPIAAPKATAPAPKVQAKPQPEAQPQAQKPGWDPANPIPAYKNAAEAFVKYLNDKILEESRPLTAGEAQVAGSGVLANETSRNLARDISAARARDGVTPTTAEMIFPTSESKRRLDVATGNTPKPYSSYPGSFVGDVLSAPVRLGASVVMPLAKVAWNTIPRFPNEQPRKGGIWGSYLSDMQNWATDPTGVTGSPSSSLFLVPGVNTEKILSEAGEIAASKAASGMLPKLIQAGAKKAISSPKETKAMLRFAEGAASGAGGYATDILGINNRGGGGDGSLPLSVGLGGFVGLGGNLLAGHAAEAIPGFRQVIADVQKGYPKKDQVRIGLETEAILRDELKKIGGRKWMGGIQALDDVATGNLGKSGELFDYVEGKISPKMRAWLDERPPALTAAQHMANGVPEREAILFDNRPYMPPDIRDEYLIWRNADKTEMDVNDPKMIGPRMPVLLDDISSGIHDDVRTAAFYGAPGTAAHTLDEIGQKVDDKMATVKFLQNPSALGAVLYLDDLSRMRSAANVKQGTSMRYGNAQLQNVIGSQGPGQFATKFKYGNNRKLTELGLEPTVREAGKLYKSGKLMESLATGDVKVSMRDKNWLARQAGQFEKTKYRVPLLFHALGVAMEKNAAKFAPNAERNR